MAHDIYWLKPGAVLYINYRRDQDVATISDCLDDVAEQLDSVDYPVVVLINWLDVTDVQPGALLDAGGHRAYRHPMAARLVLVGFPRQARFENEVAVVRTRGEKNTRYFDTMEPAMDYLKDMLAGA
jgi:hypothetical protein